VNFYFIVHWGGRLKIRLTQSNLHFILAKRAVISRLITKSICHKVISSCHSCD